MLEFARQAVALGGTVSAEHGLGKRKAHLLELQYTREQIDAMKQVKRRLDPQWLLGQGTLFPVMKRDADFFEGKEPILIYIAKRLKDALKLENILTGAGVDYGVEPDTYRGGFVFQSERIGAFFYVLEEGVEAARAVLVNNGYKPHEPE